MQADCGDKALEICNQGTQRIDLLLTDVMMPKMKGPELAEHIKALYPRIRVLFMSGYTDHAVMHRDLTPGTAFIQKPFTPEVLARKVRMVLDAEPVRG